jgi:hypothetical protein
LTFRSGLPDFMAQHTQTGKIILNYHKIYQITKNIPTTSILRLFKIYPKR